MRIDHTDAAPTRCESLIRQFVGMRIVVPGLCFLLFRKLMRPSVMQAPYLGEGNVASTYFFSPPRIARNASGFAFSTVPLFEIDPFTRVMIEPRA